MASSSPPPVLFSSSNSGLPEDRTVPEEEVDSVNLDQRLDKLQDPLEGTTSLCLVSSGESVSLTDVCNGDENAPQEVEDTDETTDGTNEDTIGRADELACCSSNELDIEISLTSQSNIREKEQGIDEIGSFHDVSDGEQISDDEQIETKDASKECEGSAVATKGELSDDDFGDFDSFRGCVEVEENVPSVETNSGLVEKQNDLVVVEVADEFTDFENATCEIGASDDDFASFDKVVSFDRSSDWAGDLVIGDEAKMQQEEEEDDEFGDFDCARAVEDTSLRCDVVDGFDLALTSAFPSPLSSHNEAESGVEANSELDVWSHLCDVDTTNALTYQWSSSHSNRRLVLALRINSRNVQLPGTGWSSLVPAFASTLTTSPLEPTKALVNNDVDDKLASSGVGTKHLNSVSPQDLSFIPQAQFDWSSSGLTNPLEDDTTSALLDLDFFLTNDAPNSESPPPFNSLERELLDSGNSQAEQHRLAPLSTDFEGQQPSPILHKILLDSARSTTMMQSQMTKNRPVGLTDEAKRILDSLPDLSFLRAKVLMFPIRSLAP